MKAKTLTAANEGKYLIIPKNREGMAISLSIIATPLLSLAASHSATGKYELPWWGFMAIIGLLGLMGIKAGLALGLIALVGGCAGMGAAHVLTSMNLDNLRVYFGICLGVGSGAFSGCISKMGMAHFILMCVIGIYMGFVVSY